MLFVAVVFLLKAHDKRNSRNVAVSKVFSTSHLPVIVIHNTTGLSRARFIDTGVSTGPCATATGYNYGYTAVTRDPAAFDASRP